MFLVPPQKLYFNKMVYVKKCNCLKSRCLLFLFSKSSCLSLGPIQHFYSICIGFISEAKRAKHEYLSSPSRAEVKNEGIYTSTPRIRFRDMEGGNITF